MGTAQEYFELFWTNSEVKVHKTATVQPLIAHIKSISDKWDELDMQGLAGEAKTIS